MATYFFHAWGLISIFWYIIAQPTNQHSMKKQNVTFEITESLVMENSFGIVCGQNDVKLEITIGFIDDERGFFEIYDIESGGQNWYAEGELIFDNDVLIDYDGVFELIPAILDKLEEMNIDVSDFR